MIITIIIIIITIIIIVIINYYYYYYSLKIFLTQLYTISILFFSTFYKKNFYRTFIQYNFLLLLFCFAAVDLSGVNDKLTKK